MLFMKGGQGMKIKLLIAAIAIIGFVLFPTQTQANSAEPPMITIIIEDVNLDANANMIIGDYVLEGHVQEIKIETYIRFYQSDLPMDEELDNVIFMIETNDKNYEIQESIESREYNQVYTLDQESSELTQGKSLLRNLKFIGLRLGLTLAIEALVFFLLGYRKTRTWIIFLVVNLITQGWLNIDITFNWQPNSYVLFSFVIMEILILAAELIMFLLSVKEGKKLKLAFTVLIANISSLFIGDR